MMLLSPRSYFAMFAVLAALLAATPASARDPLLVAGKTTLFQRVLTRPAAPLTREPGGGDIVKSFAPFEIFYVYARTEVAGKEYLEVGRSLGNAEGWLPADSTIEWRQAIVLGFNNPANRPRSLIYRDREGLEATVRSEDVRQRLETLRSEAAAAELPAGSPVISIEPDEFVDIERQFYILPILEASRIRLPAAPAAKMLRIASVSEAAAGPSQEISREEALRHFRVGVTFVIDTTQSMQPYIDEVREAVRRLRDRIAGSPEADRFRFGLVAFRDNIGLVPGLDYVTRVFLPLDETATADKFLAAINHAGAATVSSEGFAEDSIAGVYTALEKMKWEGFGGRFIILITDAAPRAPGPQAMMGSLAAPELHQLLEQKGVALFTLHLKTDAGRFDHENAETSYRDLSRYAGTPLYFPIAGGRAEDFGRQVDMLAHELERMVGDAVDGRLREAQTTRAPDIGGTTGNVGRAMQLAYLGSLGGARAPEVFEGWLTDRDPVERVPPPVTPYLLMSKNDLSTLRDVIKRAIELGTDPTRADRGTFFQRLRESVALIAQRPEAVQNAGTLGDLLGEYLADLPYNSEILNLRPEDFRDMSPIRERQLFDTLRSKVAALERIHGEAARWHSIAPGAPPGQSVTIVPLSLMP